MEFFRKVSQQGSVSPEKKGRPAAWEEALSSSSGSGSPGAGPCLSRLQFPSVGGAVVFLSSKGLQGRGWNVSWPPSGQEFHGPTTALFPGNCLQGNICCGCQLHICTTQGRRGDGQAQGLAGEG